MIIFLQISFYFIWDEDSRINNEKDKKSVMVKGTMHILLESQLIPSGRNGWIGVLDQKLPENI